MLVLVGTSTLAAALVPPPSERASTSTTSTSPRTSEVPTGGELVRATINAGSRRLERVRVPLGDQLALRVRSRRPGQIEVGGLGLLDDVAPLSPARFDILAVREGRFEVRRLEPRARLGVVAVSEAPRG